MRSLHFDCFSGISGDMTVGALLDAGAGFETLREAIASLGLEGCRLEAARIEKHGIAATQFRVILDKDTKQPHRHLHHILDILQEGELPREVRQNAAGTFTRLAEAEASVHGTTAEKVHFHEVGAVDAIVDIVGAQFAMHLLGIERVTASALAVGFGTVRCAHGVVPVPAPATVKLLEGIPIYGGSSEGELVTPTGAAIVAQRATEFGPAPLMTVERTGYGSGTRDYPDHANVLRVMIGETGDAEDAACRIAVVETNIDDMNPELFPPLLAALLEGGARDAFLTPLIGKKGRPAYRVTALCGVTGASEMARIIFGHSTSLGVRMREERRIVLEREWKMADTPWGAVRVKRGLEGGAAKSVAPEFEDCRACAETAGVPVRTVYEAALAAALKGDLRDA